MTRYKYIIRVTFANRHPECKHNGIIMSGFLNGRVQDEYEFRSTGFILKAERATKYEDGKILNSSRNGIYEQMLKGLLVYYPFASHYPKVKSISIVRGGRVPVEYQEGTDFIQPIEPTDKQNPYPLDPVIIPAILSDNDKSHQLRVALTHWMMGLTASSSTERFEFLWRTFEQLAQIKSQSQEEKESMTTISQLMLDNAAGFPKTIALATPFYDDSIFDFDWFKYVYSIAKDFGYKQNNPQSQRDNANNFLKIVKDYEDYRVMKIFQIVVSSSKKAENLLKIEDKNTGQNYLKEVIDYTTRHINAQTLRDIDLVRILTSGYAYYFRCKLFHGEMGSLPFKLRETNEDRAAIRLTNLLQVAIQEIIPLVV